MRKLDKMVVVVAAAVGRGVVAVAVVGFPALEMGISSRRKRVMTLRTVLLLLLHAVHDTFLLTVAIS